VSVAERIEQFSGALTTGLAATLISFVIWIVRRVFTNQKQIEMLQREIQFRDASREEDRKLLWDTREDVRILRANLNGKQ
jgi:flagellar biosynthesis regulator FlaF